MAPHPRTAWNQLRLTLVGEKLTESLRAIMDGWSAFEQTIVVMKGIPRSRLRNDAVSAAKYFVLSIFSITGMIHSALPRLPYLLFRDVREIH